MTPAARLQAAIEILDEVIASARDDGPPADSIVTRYFKTRRYAGSKDRRAVRELVFGAIRAVAERPESGRGAVLALARSDPSIFDLFGEPRGPEPLIDGEPVAEAGVIPAWLNPELSALVGPDEWSALLERAPLDLRVNVARASRDEVLPRFEGARPTPLSPWGVRLPADSRVDDHPAFAEGLVEVQDEGSQMIAMSCTPLDGGNVLDLCAGAGGKSLALASAVPEAQILATDSNRARLSKLQPRADRAGATIAVRLLNPPHELEELSDVRGQADLVLVDAPCSGSGTWRRNPEGRWRLTPERLDRVVALQARLLDMAAELARPGGRIVYAVCSLLSREGAGQIEDFLSRRSSWIAEETPFAAGRLDGAGKLLTPGHDGTDGFFRRTAGSPMLRTAAPEEMRMRLLPPVLIAGVATALVTTSAVGQRPDDQLVPKSVELLRQGNAHLSAGRFVEADETLETALAVDPRNRAAYNSLARVAQRQKLFGQSIRYTKKALLLEPNDRDAIAIQGEAMVELGAVARAKENLAKLQKLCPTGCTQLAELTASITRGPTVASAKPPASPKSN